MAISSGKMLYVSVGEASIKQIRRCTQDHFWMEVANKEYQDTDFVCF